MRRKPTCANERKKDDRVRTGGEYKAEHNKYLYVRCVEEPLARVGSVPSEQEIGIPQCAHEQSTVCLQARSEE